MSQYKAGLDGVTFIAKGSKLLGGFYRGAGDTPRPTAVLLHGTPGIEKHLDIAYRLRDLGWNCLYFHFRGSWGSEGSFSFTGLADDAGAAVEWVLQQPSVDKHRIALIGGAMGGHAALLHGATDPKVRAIVSICPLVDPGVFKLSKHMAEEFAPLLTGVTSDDLLKQWEDVRVLSGQGATMASRPVLLVTADQDDLFPPSHYAEFVHELPAARWERANEADHAFSSCRPWLVRTVTEWLVAQLGA
jgi:pimeloyl-ACP methyl ester carboxylesterase